MRLPALEKNILVYRALQMTLFLFYAEDIKRQLIASVEPKINEETSKHLKGGKLMKAIFRRLVKEQIFTETESDELQELIEHRNQIAHQIQHLTGDIQFPGRSCDLRRHVILKYDYAVLNRIKKWHNQLWRRIKQNYMIVYSLDHVLFEATEKAYETELKSLRRRVDRQMVIREKKMKHKT